VQAGDVFNPGADRYILYDCWWHPIDPFGWPYWGAIGEKSVEQMLDVA